MSYWPLFLRSEEHENYEKKIVMTLHLYLNYLKGKVNEYLKGIELQNFFKIFL